MQIHSKVHPPLIVFLTWTDTQHLRFSPSHTCTPCVHTHAYYIPRTVRVLSFSLSHAQMYACFRTLLTSLYTVICGKTCIRTHLPVQFLCVDHEAVSGYTHDISLMCETSSLKRGLSRQRLRLAWVLFARILPS